MGNTHSISDNHNNSPGIQSRLPQHLEFRRKPVRQNAALEQKRIQLPPMQLKEAFSWLSLLFVSLSCLLFQREVRKPMRGDLGALRLRRSRFLLDSDTNRRAVPRDRKKTRRYLAELPC